MTEVEMTLADLVSLAAARAAAEKLLEISDATGLASEDDRLRAVAAVAALVVPEALRSYAQTLPIAADRPDHLRWVRKRHPFGQLAADGSLHALYAVYRDLDGVAVSVELGYGAAQEGRSATEAVHGVGPGADRDWFRVM